MTNWWNSMTFHDHSNFHDFPGCVDIIDAIDSSHRMCFVRKTFKVQEFSEDACIQRAQINEIQLSPQNPTLILGTCESEIFVRIESRIESAAAIRI